MAQPAHPELSIVIASWNTKALLNDCVDSIRQHAPTVSCEIIVVDNGSSDGTVPWLNAQESGITSILNEANLGFAHANNQGIGRAQGELILLLNSDTILHEGAIDTLIEYMRADKDAGVVAPRLQNPDGTLQPSWAAFPTIWSEVLGRNIRSRTRISQSPMDGAYSVDWVGGAALLIRSSVLKQVGNLDENLFMYAEETDLCRRVWSAGWRVVYLESAVVIHRGGGSAPRSSFRQLQLLHDSKLYYFAKHNGRHVAQLLRLLFIVKTALSIVIRWIGGFGLRSNQSDRSAIQARVQLLQHLATS